MKKQQKQGAWNSYYNEAEAHENATPQQSKPESKHLKMLRSIAEQLSLATYTLAKHGINIRNVNEPLLNAEKDLSKIINKKK